jgi:hypothetical protein
MLPKSYASPKPNNKPMSDEEIARYAPSVFATEKAQDRGDRYQFISSADIVQGLRGQGFLPVRAQQSRALDEAKRGHTRHIVTFRQATDIERVSSRYMPGTHRFIQGETFNEIVLYNSHDGTSSYQLHAGKFRMVCLNGLIIADSMLASVRIPHFGREVVGRAVLGAINLIEQMPLIDGVIEQWKALPLPREEQLALADAAMDLRWKAEERPGNLQPADLLTPRRTQDYAGDLWTTYNRIQEALLNGGSRYVNAKRELRKTREVASVQEKLRLNKSLWKLTAHMAELHGVAMPSSGAEEGVIEGEIVA